MAKHTATLDSDSDDGTIGLPGDVDEQYDFGQAKAGAEAAEDKQPVEKPLGFEILGFQSGQISKAPPKDLAARLAARSKKKDKKPKRNGEAREAKKPRVKREKRVVAPPPPAAEEDPLNGTLNSTIGRQMQGQEIGVAVGIEENEAKKHEPPPELTDEIRDAAANAIKLLGEETVRLIKSTFWYHRSEGWLAIKDAVHDKLKQDAASKADALAVIFEHCLVALSDTVFQVFTAALSLTTHLLTSYVNDMNQPGYDSVVRTVYEQAIPLCIARLGEANSRVREASKEALLAYAAHPFIGVGCVARECTTLVSVTQKDWKLLIGKLTLGTSLVQEHEMNTGEADEDAKDLFTLKSVMELAVAGLNVQNMKVRKTASTLVVDVYKKQGKKSEKHLRSLPASLLKQLKQEIEVELCDVEAFGDTEIIEQEEEDLRELEQDFTVTEKQQEQLNRWMPIFETDGMKCIFSKKWKLREHIFTRVALLLSNAAENPASPTPLIVPDNPKKTALAFAACVEIAEIGVQDGVPLLVVSCCNYISSILNVYGQHVADSLLRRHFDNVIITRLISHYASSTSSVTAAALELLRELGRHEKLGPAFVSTLLMQQDHSKSGENWKMNLARLKIIEQFVQDFEFKEEGLSTEAIMNYAVSSFQSTNGKVRSAAVGVIIEVYKKCGNVIRAYLRHQRPALLNDLKEKIAKIARKDRTKSAPIQTLASMVQPLGLDDGLDSVLNTTNQRPSTFPTTFEEVDDIPTNEPVRVRIQKWKKEQEAKENGEEPAANPPPVGPAGPCTMTNGGANKVLVTGNSSILLPPRHRAGGGQSRLVLG
eukprot:TRINITY_DN8775_c0_g1_i1.p1 TRINITY_DN8775_c0_g1~~TRINITY_DN8775_c0_g1_i1.p1  ORF type:complete len:821 (+),score=346.07 TRINITY_DN8775_c0_g1_i1:60-2522(+)